MSILIKNANVVNATASQFADLRICDGKIAEIGNLCAQDQEEVIDAGGKFVIPGCVDVHTHLDLDTGATKTADDFVTGTKAAIAGGTTTVVDFATQDHGGSLKEAMAVWQDKAKTSYCDYGFHMAIVDWNQDIRQEMLEMVEAGVPSFKLYMAYKGGLQVDDEVIYEALNRANEIGGLIGFHCENGDIIAARCKELLAQGKTSPYYHPISRPDCVEEEAINRLCTIATLADAPIWVVHLSTEKGLRTIEHFKDLGLEIITETCPQYLVLDDSLYGKEEDTSFEAAKYVMSPPLRKPSDQRALWQGLSRQEIDIISTDHCSFSLKGQKELGRNNFTKIPNGGPGLEHRLLLLYNFGVVDGKITLQQMVRFLSEAPSRLFGLTQKGAIEVGKDADLVLLDPNQKTLISAKTQVQNLDYTPYEGWELSGKVDTVFLRGQKIYHDKQFLLDNATGRYQKRTARK